MSMAVSRWNDRRIRVGWTVRLRNGKLAKVTWRSDTDASYMAKVYDPQPKPEREEVSAR